MNIQVDIYLTITKPEINLKQIAISRYNLDLHFKGKFIL